MSEQSPWPKFTPPDLRHSLEAVLSARNHGPTEVWGAVREWLEMHDVDAVELPVEKRPERFWDG